MKYYRLKIPVRAHVLKYLRKELPSPYRISESDIIGPMLIQFLRKPENDAESLASVNEMCEYWEIDFPQHLAIHRAAYHFGSRNVLTFNTYVELLMKELLYKKVQEYRGRSEQQKMAILDFMYEYEISENDLSYDGWKKAMQRLDKKKRDLLKKGRNDLSLADCA